MQTPKKFSSFSDQVSWISDEKGIKIKDREYAEEMLRQIGYFPLMGGYKHLFRISNTKKYKAGTSFEEIVSLYKFDAELRELFFKYLLQIERQMRSLMSYYFTEMYGAEQKQYLDANNYNNTKRNHATIVKLIATLKRATTTTDYTYINYYRKTYGEIPLWVLANVLTFGNLSKMFRVFPQSLKSKVSKNFEPLNQHQMEQFLSVLTKYTFRLTLPFLDRNNDLIEMYIINNGDGTYSITDDGATISDLQLGGFDFSTSARRKSILEAIVSAHGVTKTDNDELIVNCTTNDLPLKKHMLAQCMVKVSDMFYLSRSNVQSVFLEDVQKFFDAHDVRYIDNICLTGKSKLTTHYDFAIARSKNSAERFIKVVNNMDLNAARNIIFAWNDTKDMRQHEAKLYTFIQNTDKKVSDDALGALKEYGINPALWTEKDKYISELIA